LVKVVLVDIDIPFEVMQKYGLFDVLNEKVEFCLSRFNVDVETIAVDKSQCGNTHLHITLKHDISPEELIMLKFCIGEDPKRLAYTIARYEVTGKILDFFWMHKIKDCEVKIHPHN